MKLHMMDIQRFALHDGPGIRTTVFLQGCPLRCPWCSNPESQQIGQHLMHLKKRCIGCGHCAAVCPTNCIAMEDSFPLIDRNRCNGCGRCVEECPVTALRFSGKVMEAADILSVLLRDQNYYRRTGGGVTLSGGEPFVQWEGAKELLMLCKHAGLHTAVETTGNVPAASITACQAFVDLFLYDLKHMDPSIFTDVTKGDLPLVLANLNRLPPEKVVLRIPVIPGFNNDEPTFRQIFAYAVDHGIHRVDLLPYHLLGKGKYEQLGLPYPYGDYPSLAKQDLVEPTALGREMGLDVR